MNRINKPIPFLFLLLLFLGSSCGNDDLNPDQPQRGELELADEE